MIQPEIGIRQIARAHGFSRPFAQVGLLWGNLIVGFDSNHAALTLWQITHGDWR